MNYEEKIMALLAMMAEQSGETVSDMRLEFTCKRLMEMDCELVVKALYKLIDTCRRFPTLGEIKQQMGDYDPTAKDTALQIVDTVFQGISRYGSLPPGNTKTAIAIERALGPTVWEVVKRQGGWNSVVERAGENQAAYRAQLRDLVESYMKCGVIAAKNIPTELPGLHTALSRAQKPNLRLITADDPKEKLIE